MKKSMYIITAAALCLMLLHANGAVAAAEEDIIYFSHPQSDQTIVRRGNTGQLPPPIVTDNSVEICLDSRVSQHSLRGTVSNQQLSNILWAAAGVPFTGTHRDIYALTPAATFLYDPVSNSLNQSSDQPVNEGALALHFERQLDFDAGLSFMPAILASVSLCRSSESAMASCPKGLGLPKTRVYFGVQSGQSLTTQLVARSSVPEGRPGWLPDPSTDGDNSLEEVLSDLKYVSNFSQTNLTLQQISQLLWAGYGCTPHNPSGRAGLTVPSAWANYYLTRSIYLVNDSGVHRYHNRNPETNLSTRDHRIEQIKSNDSRDALRAAVDGLPEAPCYVVLCLDSSYVGQEFAQLEVGFVASNMLIQASAMDLGCYFTTQLTSDQQANIQAATNIPSSHLPQAIVSIGSLEVQVAVSVTMQAGSRPDSVWKEPLNVMFFSPGADVLNDVPIYNLKLAAAKSANSNQAVCEATGIAPGVYDVTVCGQSSLTNVRKNVQVTAPKISVDMGTLLEGNANKDDIIQLDDFVILSKNWLSKIGIEPYDPSPDFDRNGTINASDLFLMANNWLKTSPIQIEP